MSEPRSLPDPPTDGITSLSYVPHESHKSLLASTSWDGGLRVYDTLGMSCSVTRNMESGPLLSLSAAPDEGGVVYTGGLDGSVRKFDLSTNKPTLIGKHTGKDVSLGENGVSCVSCFPHDNNLVASASWDANLHLWDVRSSSGSPSTTISLPGKAFSMDANEEKIVVATSGRRTVLLDVRKNSNGGGELLEEDVVERESSLKYQTRVVRFFPDGRGMALGSIEGRVAVEYLDEVGEGKKKKYAFKCHRVNETVYPVNAIAFHPTFGTFATGGADGTVVIWDGMNKKRLTALPKFATSIAAVAFNEDGTELAIASSYTFEEGERDHPRDEIFVRAVAVEEVRPKS